MTAADKWGLPDWRDATAYSQLATRCGEDLTRWRWEFFRRRRDLREDFEKNADAAYALRRKLAEVAGDCVSIPLPSERGFTTSPFGGARYGYDGIPNPRISDQPDATIRFISAERDVPGFFPSTLYPEGAPMEGDWQTGVVFELNLPLEPQIAAARKFLRKEQEMRLGPTFPAM